jgi:phage-related baseplate assembly protein
VQSRSSFLLFASDNDLVIPAGYSNGFVSASCTTVGAVGNNLPVGDIVSVMNWTQPFAVTATNTEVTGGGSDTETTEAYRRRLFGITDSYSAAGPKGRYKDYAMAVSPAIADVSVMGPEDGLAAGHVNVTFLLQNGVYPNDTMINNVYTALNTDTVRDLCAYLSVGAPSGVPYSCHVDYWVDESQSGNAIEIQQAVQTAVTGWITENQTALGGSINPATLTVRVQDAGASYCQVIEPAARIGLNLNEVGVVVDDVVVNYKGIEQDLQL